MTVKCGTDIVYIPGIARILHDDVLLNKFLNPGELSVPELNIRKGSTSLEHLAGVISAKEAFFKALGVVPKFHDIQITYEPSGRPKLIVTPEWHTYTSCDVSISHDHQYAIAMVVLMIASD